MLPLPDRNRDVPVRNIPFPISRNTGFVFPSGLPVPVSVPDKKIQEREWLRHFPDRSRPFSSLIFPSADSKQNHCISRPKFRPVAGVVLGVKTGPLRIRGMVADSESKVSGLSAVGPC